MHFRTEKSTDQVVKPVNTEALSKWVGKIPHDVVKDMAQIAPMLAHLGDSDNFILLSFPFFFLMKSCIRI